MHIRSKRISIFVAAVCLQLPFTIEAQKDIIPSDKPVSTTQIPNDRSIVLKTKQKISLSTLELAVVEEINPALSNPQKFVAYLQKRQTRLNFYQIPFIYFIFAPTIIISSALAKFLSSFLSFSWVFRASLTLPRRN